MERDISDSLSAANDLQAKHSAICLDLLYLELKQSQQQQFCSALLQLPDYKQDRHDHRAKPCQLGCLFITSRSRQLQSSTLSSYLFGKQLIRVISSFLSPPFYSFHLLLFFSLEVNSTVIGKTNPKMPVIICMERLPQYHHSPFTHQMVQMRKANTHQISMC